MTTDPQAFNANLAAWKRDEHTPWGRLRRTLAFRNLSAHLPAGPLAVLDAGGGNGRDSLPLARCGHRIDLVDYSAEMLRDAEAVAREEGIDGSRLAVHEAAVAAIPGLFAPAMHDVVLLHNVLSYIADPVAALTAATHSLRPGGILSLMQVNRHNGPMHEVVWNQNLGEALAKLDARTSTARIFDDVPVIRYAPEDLTDLLEQQGFSLLQHYGILCACGYILDNEIKGDPVFFEKLERLEIAMSTRHPFRLLAKFTHLVAAAPGA